MGDTTLHRSTLPPCVEATLGLSASMKVGRKVWGIPITCPMRPRSKCGVWMCQSQTSHFTMQRIPRLRTTMYTSSFKLLLKAACILDISLHVEQSLASLLFLGRTVDKRSYIVQN